MEVWSVLTNSGGQPLTNSFEEYLTISVNVFNHSMPSALVSTPGLSAGVVAQKPTTGILSSVKTTGTIMGNNIDAHVI